MAIARHPASTTPASQRTRLAPLPATSRASPLAVQPRRTPTATAHRAAPVPSSNPAMPGLWKPGTAGRGATPNVAAGATPSGPSGPTSSGAGGLTRIDVPKDGRILLIGITGATGRSALQGLLSVAGPGRTAHTLLAMSRNPGGSTAAGLPAGVQVVRGDLDDPPSLEPALRGVDAVYCHALSKDGSTADPQELVRARSLAAAAKAAGVRLIMYNSSGGKGCGYGITQMEQKHQVEDILASAVPTVALQATLFMEELWKRYTRPGILKGTFTWSTPSDRPIQLVAARDLGLVAGSLLAGGGAHVPASPRPLLCVELAGDELTPDEMCAAFAAAQGSPVKHQRAPAWPFYFLARDVWRISRFLTERGFGADVANCRQQYPGLLTFRDFLDRTGWADPGRTFEDGIAFAEAQGQQASKSKANTPA
ncbi:hypothetical protein HYH03_001218 [Edaphochlamys debaryana]|uniref:NmrA-like domain-containing protein n=1 Tax=Edaphochlamys debaryana TaxID=47281 RepID=A0A835YEM3_9CHLO|nr:hypothetical protein HYH03_001218 [Edaphochlamys debaryana]|eukprot:KAG2501435.1 hypothetical protein HYH03_001218 [Edaphochlamys debaryana]